MIQFDGHNVFALEYDGILAKKHAAYASVKRSLGYCLNSIYYINSHREKTDESFVNEHITAHSTTLIIHYGRCFAALNAKGRVKLDRDLVPKEYEKTHEILMTLRHDYIAHSGSSGEGVMSLVALYPNAEGKKILHVAEPILARFNYINEPFLLETQNLVMHLISHVEDKLKDQYEKICAEILAINIDDLYSEFEKYDLSGFEYSPAIRLGQYELKLEIKPDLRVYLKYVLKE